MAHAPTHKRPTQHVDADGRPQVNPAVALALIAAAVLLLATSAVSERLVG